MTLSKKQYFILILPFLVTAIFSGGFYHPDEHFSILELVNVKLNPDIGMSHLNWDIHEQMRSWLQPWFGFMLAKIFSNPFSLAFVLRLINGLLGVYSLILIAPYIVKKSKVYQALLVSSYTWFIPFIFCRTSSESISISLFLMGCYFLLRYDNWKLYLAAFLWGLSFILRFQMGVPIFVGFFWTILFFRKTFSQYFFLSLIFLATLGLGVLADHWGYDSWSLTAWNYFRENLIAGRSKNFGVAPWYYYFKLVFIKGIPPLSLVFGLGVFTYWKRRFLDLFTLSGIAFLFVHFIIGHKELRFLDYLFVLSPLMLVESFSIDLKKWWVKALIGINFTIMFKTSLSPAYTPIRAYKYLSEQGIHALATPLTNGQKHDFILKFYGKDLKTVGFKLGDEIPLSDVVTTTFYEYQQLKESCNLKFSLYPTFLYSYNIGGWLNRSSVWNIWKCPVTQ